MKKLFFFFIFYFFEVSFLQKQEQLESNTEIFYTNLNTLQIISPNGDGLDDQWDIPYLKTSKKENEVIILNKFGEEVWKRKDYMKDNKRFKGYSKQNEQLPSGIYF